jgi:2-polyprenyl-3-methyl-5-hydroxy-6-metoxy-1,4-benzoquinol methylase
MMDERLIRHPLGFWQVRDMPDEAALKDYYERRYFQTARSNYRPSYAADERAWFDIKTERMAAAIAAVRGSTPGRLLDVGCGEGFAMNWFARCGWSVQGLDFSRAGMEAMNPQLLGQLRTGDVHQLLSDAIDQGERHDVLWLTNVLEHVRDPLGLLQKLRRLVGAGGVLVVTVPNDGSAWQELLFSAGRIPQRFWIAIPDHLSYFSATSLRASAEATGWRCAQLMADFPIDWYLGHAGSEYVSDPSRGRAAHQARIDVDTVLAEQPVDAVNQLYAALAAVGMGRQITAILQAASA